MSWLQPTPFEKRLVESFRGPWQEMSPLVRLARLLSLTTRIEPLLLRNSRRHFLPGSATEIESLFWFCPLIGARGNGEVVMHPGVSRLLADELRGEPTRFAEALAFTRRHTGHWLPEDRLEQELRLDTLSDDPARGQMRQGLQDMLRLVHDESDPERRIRLARSIRQTLATIGGAAGPLDELRWLNQYSSYSLGTMAAAPLGSTPLPPPPAWLVGTLPAPFRPARLAVELHYDTEENRPELHFVAAADGAEAIDFPTPLPANLHVQCQGEPGNWHVVGLDKRVRLPMARTLVWLTTLAGRRYELRGDFPAASDDRGADPTAPQLYLSHFPEDREQALAIAGWLRQHGLRIELREEGGRTVEAAAESEGDDEPMRLLRLWTPAARERLAEQGVDAVVPLARAVLLRVDPTLEPPQAGYGADRLLDLPDLRTTTQAERTSAFLRQLHDWLSDAAPPEPPEPPPGDASSEVDRLLAELQDPQTLPPRRLAIGDRLAEIGDPRPGVGVREYVVRPAEAERLLAEIAEPTTVPPRRLAIGDRLAEIGDPRRGVGLDSRGLPEIDWVEIPGGEFIYQDGERRTLPGFSMARYPVTNAQYQAFIDAGGYRDERWWQGLKRPEPETPSWPQANRPRTNVDWYEAVAFSRWLSKQLGYEVRLPNELEWERVARGRDGREYPWGKAYESGRANINETRSYDRVGEWNLQQTTAVGVYPHGTSSEGVLDLSGNVWEWCLNTYDRPEQAEADTSGQSRVLRGGSWDGNPDLARGSRRGTSLPGSRYNYRGFRLVSSAPIR